MKSLLALGLVLALVLGPAALASEPYCPPTENPYGAVETPLPTYRMITDSGTEIVYHFVLQRRPDSYCNPATSDPVEGQNWLAMLRWTEANGWYLVTSMSCDVAETFEQTYGLVTASLTLGGDGFILSCAQTDSDIYDPVEGPWTVRTQVTNLLGKPVKPVHERSYTDRPRLGDGFIYGDGPGTITLLTENGFVDTDIAGCRISDEDLLAAQRAGGLTGVVCRDQVHIFDGTTRLQSHQLARSEDEHLVTFRMVEHGGTVMGAFALRIGPAVIVDGGSDSTFIIATLDDLRVAMPTRQEYTAPNLRSATFLAGENGLDAIWLEGPVNDEHAYPVGGLLDLGLSSGDWEVLDSDLVAYTAYSSDRTDDAWFVWSEFGPSELLLLSITGSGASRTITNTLGEMSYLPYPYSTFWQYCIGDDVRYTCWDYDAQ